MIHYTGKCPMLVSRCKITHENLSEYQINQIKEKRENNSKLKHIKKYEY